MKVNAFIVGCEIGVYLNHCCNARISTIIQPRTAYDTTLETIKDNLKYALYGIYLNECTNVDLTGSRVWDWDSTHTRGGPILDPNDPNAHLRFQHIRLNGDCHGLILDDFLYYEMSGYNIRDLIYTLTPENYDNMTILQEPVSKFIRFEKESVDGIESTTFNKTYLQNRVYVKKEFVEGLEEELQNLSQRITDARSDLGLPPESNNGGN